MQTLDPRCNALQSIVGVFLHASSTPEKVVKVLSRMGISISLTSIHRAIRSLSNLSYLDIENLGRTLLTSYGFDNFDILLRTLIPTTDGKLERGQLHMTSATLLRLDHDVTLDDLRCAQFLWARSENNPMASNPIPFSPLKALHLLSTLHPEPDYQDGDLGRQAQFRSWMFLQTLIKYGPTYFTSHTRDLPHPTPVEAIPVTQTHQVPLSAMDINPSTVAGNIEAIFDMYSQAGVGPSTGTSAKSKEPLEDISDFVTIMHGDLGTYEKVLSACRRRSVEHTPFSRLNSVVFVMGLFHLKMAAADAIWRLLVAPDGARSDETSFMKIAGRLRPKESSRLVAGAKFRQQHELIQHVGAILRLDAWRVEVQKRTGKKISLQEWAETKPSFADVQAVADCLACDYVEGEWLDLHERSLQRAEERDVVLENTTRVHNYLLLYEELSYAMNAGDIGRLEILLGSWVPLFRAAGKHKYGTQTLRFFHSLYFVYPDRLR